MNSKNIQEASNVFQNEKRQSCEPHQNRSLKKNFSDETCNAEFKPNECQLSPPSEATSSSSTTGAINISPGKKNKRKMAEPRRRITDFSIRNICSESTSCSSFASEIEADNLLEKRSRMEKVSQNKSDLFLASSANSIARDFRSLQDAAPLDVLVSLSLLTQHHNHHRQLQQLVQPHSVVNSSSPLQDIPGLPKLSPRELPEELKRNTRLRSFVKTDEDFHLNFKNRLNEHVGMPEASKYDCTSRCSSTDVKTSNEEGLLTKFKSEQDSESVGIAEEVTEKRVTDRSFIEKSSDNLEKIKKKTSQHQQEHKTSFVDRSPCNQNNSFNSHGGAHQRKNYKNMTKQRRIEANARERTRVHTISAAFESLRKAVPSYSHNQRLSKLAILRIACSYILALVKLAELEDYETSEMANLKSSADSMTFSQCVDLCTQTIQSEGKTKRRHWLCLKALIRCSWGSC